MKFKCNHLIKTLAIGSVFLLAACGGTDQATNSDAVPPPPGGMSTDYQALLDKTVAAGVPGAVLYISSPELSFYGSAGLADIASHMPMLTDARIPNGSAGKKLTALLAAMLHEEGRLDLDAPISTYLPVGLLSRIPYSEQMTTRMLLNHTSGLFDYLNESDGAFYAAVINDPESIKTDEFALQFALDQPANFAPDTGWKYSNTGYILTGLILDRVLGEHHSTAMRHYILSPLGLHSMSYGGLERDHAPIVSGYFEDDSGEQVNTLPYYRNIGVADAPVVGNARDMAELLRYIVEGPQVSPANRTHLIGEPHLTHTDVPGVLYGAGVFKETTAGQVIFHHGGSELGYATFNLYFPTSKTAVAALFNCNGYEACDKEYQVLMNKVTGQILSKQ